MKFSGQVLALFTGTNALLFQAPSKPVSFHTSTSLQSSLFADNSFTPFPVTDDGFVANGDSKQQDLNARLSALENKGGSSGMARRPGATDARFAGFEKGQSSINAEEGLANKIWNKAAPILVQGGSLKTWSFASPLVERVHVVMKTEALGLHSRCCKHDKQMPVFSLREVHPPLLHLGGRRRSALRLSCRTQRHAS